MKTTEREQATHGAPVHAAEIVREYGPFSGADKIHGVTHDGRRVWAATGPTLVAFDPATGELERTLDCGGDAVHARITALSGERLQLHPGKTIFAIIKTVALDTR